jgi:hypothetical protein
MEWVCGVVGVVVLVCLLMYAGCGDAVCVFQEALPFFLLLGYSFWVPQILHGAHRDTTDGLSNLYVLGTTGSRLFMPLYVHNNNSQFTSPV